MGLGQLRERVATWRRWRLLEAQGPPPTNVRIITAGGIQQPVSCRYDGYYDQRHHWRVMPPPGPVYGVVFDDLPDSAAVVVSRAGPTRT